MSSYLWVRTITEPTLAARIQKAFDLLDGTGMPLAQQDADLISDLINDLLNMWADTADVAANAQRELGDLQWKLTGEK